jgi:hypothetical protein
MKTIELRTVDDLSYRDILKEVVRRPLDPQRGADIAEMRQSIRLLDALELGNGTLELEDADYQVLVEKVKAMRWNVIDARLVGLIDEVLGAS